MATSQPQSPKLWNLCVGITCWRSPRKRGTAFSPLPARSGKRDRRDIGVGRESISTTIQDALKLLMGGSGMDKPKFQGRHFPWSAKFSDGRRASDETITDPRDAAAVQIDFRFVPTSEQAESNLDQTERRECIAEPRCLGLR